MRVVVTCGPSYEPIDEVRRITNFSTGELGILLSNALAAAGHSVLCMKGTGATCAIPLERVEVVPFSTNEDFEQKLCDIARSASIGAIFHAAALCDFRVKTIATAEGPMLPERKVSSRSNELMLTLEPAKKVIGLLRELFPAGRIVGWKYELNGTRAEALGKAEGQMRENHTDGCVINGSAYGNGFGWCEPGRPVLHCDDKGSLCKFLTNWLH